MEIAANNETNRKLPLVADIDGKHYTVQFEAEKVRSISRLKVRPSDIFICTAAKAGTTWIQHIVHLLLQHTPYEDEATTLFDVSPLIERFGADHCDRLESPRILKTHLPYSAVPKNAEAKYILGVRNVKDCLVSIYHQCKSQFVYEFADGKLSDFVPYYLSGKFAFGAYFEHLRGWLSALNEKNERILLVKYEDMIADPVAGIRAIGEFIGSELAEGVKDEAFLEKVVCKSSFSEMQQKQERWYPKEFFRENIIRRGGVGKWREYLSKEESELIDQHFYRELGGTDAVSWWKEEMKWTDC